jgi:hypothetical protein
MELYCRRNAFPLDATLEEQTELKLWQQPARPLPFRVRPVRGETDIVSEVSTTDFSATKR